MSELITNDFLLTTPLAQRLFHEHAAAAPIIDFHCHLDAQDLALDRRFANIGQLWVTTDPYKHRAMRIAGVPEKFITGLATDQEKFLHWAETVPQTLGNPLYHWTALELKRYFDIDEPLSPASAERIWQHCNQRLAEPDWTARGLLRQRNVECVCTSDRLLDDLSAHATLATVDFGTRVLPSLRADDITAVESPGFENWVRQLGALTGTSITSYSTFWDAVVRRLDAFQTLGCRLADHALDDFVYVKVERGETAALFQRLLSSESLSTVELLRLRCGLLHELGVNYGQRGWILQLHLGAKRHTSTRLRNLLGSAGGFASIGNTTDVPSLCGFLDHLETEGRLPRTILYPLNPVDFAALATLSGSFVEDGVAGKVQLGPAWWFNDHASGMRAQLEAIANHGLLSVSIGMTTDSRSLLSMTRHEYFRRVLCGWLGEQVERGAFPNHPDELARLVCALVYHNPKRALGL
ncbi:MAG: glucuronate isomerase [Opitutus sp.]